MKLSGWGSPTVGVNQPGVCGSMHPTGGVCTRWGLTLSRLDLARSAATMCLGGRYSRAWGAIAQLEGDKGGISSGEGKWEGDREVHGSPQHQKQQGANLAAWGLPCGDPGTATNQLVHHPHCAWLCVSTHFVHILPNPCLSGPSCIFHMRSCLQMHIHIAHWESSRAVAGVPFENWLARRVAAATDVSSDPRSPTRILGEGYYNPAAWVHTPLGRPPRNWARAYAIHVASSDPVNDLGVSRVGVPLYVGFWGMAGGLAWPWCFACHAAVASARVYVVHIASNVPSQ